MAKQVFVDTNIFLQLLTKAPAWEKAAAFLDTEEYELVSSALVMNELKYKLLWISATQELNSTKKFTIIDHIKKNAKLRERVYTQFLEFFINLKARCTILNINATEELLCCALSSKYGLLPTDAAIVTSMISHDITKIATDDEDFKQIKEIEVIML